MRGLGVGTSRLGLTADRLRLSSHRLGLAVLLAVLATVPLLIPPAGEFPVDDDWAYAQSVQHLLITGTFERSVWIDTAFVAQAWWGVLVSHLLGFSHTCLRIGTLLLAAVAITFTYLLLARALRPALALAATLLLLFHPLFLHLSYTFMTDVPFLAAMLAAIWCITLALEPGNRHSLTGSHARLGWLVAGSATIGLACLIRQIGIVLVPAVLLGAFPELRVLPISRWRLLVVLAVPFAAVLAAGSLAAGPGDVGVESRFLDIFLASDPASLLDVALKETAASAALLGLSAVPAAPLLLTRPGIRARARWQWLLALGLLLLLAWAVWHRWAGLAGLSPLFGNTLSTAGFTTSGLHPRSIALDEQALAVLAVVGLVGAVVLMLALAGALSRSIERSDLSAGAMHCAPTESGSVGAQCITLIDLPLPLRLLVLSSLGMLAATLGYGPVGGPVNGLYDRYLLPALPGVLALVAYAVRARRLAVPLFLVGAVLFVGWSVPWQREYLARQAAVWTVAETLVASGVPATEIDAGYEWAGWTRGGMVIERARAAALQAGEPRQFVQQVVDGLYRPSLWYVGFERPGWGCARQAQVAEPYGDGFTAYGLRRCRPQPAPTT